MGLGSLRAVWYNPRACGDVAMTEPVTKTNDAPHDDQLRQKVAAGLVYAHSRLNATTSRTLEAASFLYALVELLEERGLISVDELDARQQGVAERLSKQVEDSGMGVMLQDPEEDKYTFASGVEIDCENRIDLCRAACCKLNFALSRQDIREGVVRWDLGRPYMIEQGDDGYCNHLDRGTKRCSIHASRPVPCRAFDCRNDKRIWVDFERRIPNPGLARPGWPHSEATNEQASTPCPTCAVNQEEMVQRQTHQEGGAPSERGKSL